MGRTLPAFLALVCLAGAAPSQVPPDLPRITSSVELSLVNLDVVVTDRDGKAVHGLAASDFEVLHGGKPVKVTNFREERSAAGNEVAAAPPPAAGDAQKPLATPAAAEAPASARPSRHVVLFVDRLALPDPRERREVFASLKALLRRTMAPGDEAMVVAWDRSIRTVHPFTGDLPTLDLALDVVARESSRLASETTEIENLAADDAWFQAVGAGDSETSRNLDAAQVYQQVKAKVAALKGLVGVMAGMEGRKALVVVSRRLSRRAGAEFGTGGIDTRSLMESLAEAANAAEVTLHTIYAAEREFELPQTSTSRFTNPRFTGPVNSGRVQANWNNEIASLGMLAERTGGVLAGSTAEAPAFVNRVASDLESWYSLGYPVPAAAARSDDVTVRVRKAGLVVRTRRSVVQKAPEEQMQERVLANLFRWDRNASLPIAVSYRPTVAAKRGRFRTPVEVRVPVKSLVLLPSGNGSTGAVSLFFVSADASGEFSGVVRQRKTIEIPAPELERAMTSYLTYSFEVETRTPDARISIGVYDETGRSAGFRVLKRAATPAHPSSPRS